MIHIGIDVGVTGAIAALQNGVYLDLQDLPINTSGKAKWVQGGGLLQILHDMRGVPQPTMVTVEATHAMPGNGSVAAHSQGMTLGSVLAVLDIAGMAYELVQPAVWKRELGLNGKGLTDTQRKAAALNMARQRFPGAPLERQKDHNRAEAILIAHYAQRRWKA
jgi:crossover junction endodeoxyribonuclease RuvC